MTKVMYLTEIQIQFKGVGDWGKTDTHNLIATIITEKNHSEDPITITDIEESNSRLFMESSGDLPHGTEIENIKVTGQIRITDIVTDLESFKGSTGQSDKTHPLAFAVNYELAFVVVKSWYHEIIKVCIVTVIQRTSIAESLPNPMEPPLVAVKEARIRLELDVDTPCRLARPIAEIRLSDLFLDEHAPDAKDIIDHVADPISDMILETQHEDTPHVPFQDHPTDLISDVVLQSPGVSSAYAPLQLTEEFSQNESQLISFESSSFSPEGSTGDTTSEEYEEERKSKNSRPYKGYSTYSDEQKIRIEECALKKLSENNRRKYAQLARDVSVELGLNVTVHVIKNTLGIRKRKTPTGDILVSAITKNPNSK